MVCIRDTLGQIGRVFHWYENIALYNVVWGALGWVVYHRTLSQN